LPDVSCQFNAGATINGNFTDETAKKLILQNLVDWTRRLGK
jgi:hypothetical protein